ncbi:MAG: hypothetical protein COX77_01530 [Candidatus Komeilibacteria bacterium CG_4_10_14_0_2_um_filter_37_10]|uniref:DUF5666 domain-containing protein n=1 Tax=Candidatus Komeilibacteria bacterium CG_4_10_14_0_2_um_filter_37_10 TaxID=1974470 RepID=A0A2M7VFN5_9BACT|nr:MAG: hypothetical protein COX77_01530 [Candidatus Komeilibacteria bacterium CG_4_10_14_0_2_um_filter_37_10]
MNWEKISKSKFFTVSIYVLVLVVVMLIVFEAGFWIGARKSGFTKQWSENYHRNFGSQRNDRWGSERGDFMMVAGGRMMDPDFINAGGAMGQIIKIQDQSIIIRDRQEIEKVVLVNDQTTIKLFRDTLDLNNLKVDDQVVVIGESNNQGQITARLIRIMPAVVIQQNTETPQGN